MRVPLRWLREYCDPALDVAALAARLTLTGTKVEAVHHHGVPSTTTSSSGACSRPSSTPTPTACGSAPSTGGRGEPATIVCGAPNVAAGQTVAVARPGRGCPTAAARRGEAPRHRQRRHDPRRRRSRSALGHAGIIVLDERSAGRAGHAARELLPLGTDVLELEVTPNRPDCLGVYGVAREVHAATGAPLAPPPWSEDPGAERRARRASRSPSSARTSARASPRACSRTSRSGPRRCGSRRACSAAGQRPISNVVDITNYVMLLTGQPLHAFDLDRVAGGAA